MTRLKKLNSYSDAAIPIIVNFYLTDILGDLSCYRMLFFEMRCQLEFLFPLYYMTGYQRRLGLFFCFHFLLYHSFL